MVIITTGIIIAVFTFKNIDQNRTKIFFIYIAILTILGGIVGISGLFYLSNYSTDYEITIYIDIKHFHSDYSIIIPVPSDENGNPRRTDIYPDEWELVETKYGWLLKIDSNEDRLFNSEGFTRGIIFERFSMNNNTIGSEHGSCWFYINSTERARPMTIEITFNNGGSFKGYRSIISQTFSDNGWFQYYYSIQMRIS